MRVSKLLNDAQVRALGKRGRIMWAELQGCAYRYHRRREVVGSGSCHVAAAGFATQST